jgi:hypothetical protein
MPSLVETIRQTVLHSFMSLPLMIILFLGFMSVALGNVGLIILFLGHITVVPVLTSFLNLVSSILLSIPGITTVRTSDVCTLIPGMPWIPFDNANITNVFPSFWMANFFFFISYFIQNAMYLSTKKPLEGAAQELINNRKARAIAALIVGITIAILFPILRYSLTGCETIPGILVAAATFVPLGVGWYYMATATGARDGDIFGITSAILPASSTNPRIMACAKS